MDTYQLLLVSSLLHDVGHLRQRVERTRASGSAGPVPADAEASPLVDRAAAQLPPPAWRADLPPRLADQSRPGSRLVTRLVRLADRLAAGVAPGQTAEATWTARLESIFARIGLDAGRDSSGAGGWYQVAGPLRLEEEAIFPRHTASREGVEDLAPLLDALVDAIGRLPDAGFEATFETVYFLLQQYTWAAPAGGGGGATDVSSFDRARITAAIAAALYRGGISEDEVEALVRGDAEALSAPRMMLLGGDVSGVQAFLYTLRARGAGRSLRGRSFFLQLLTEACARWLLRRLELPISSLLYAGGGRFYILAQRLSDAEMVALRAYVDRALLRCHGGELCLALGGVALSAGALLTGAGTSEAWRTVGAVLAEQKRRKLGSLPAAELHEAALAPRGVGGEVPTCEVCRAEGASVVDADTDERTCTLCASFARLGTELRDARYLYLGRAEAELPAGGARAYGDALRAFGIEARLIGSDEDLGPAPLAGRDGTLLALDAPDILREPMVRAARAAGGRLALGFWLTASVTPRRGRAVAEFADLVAASRGVRRLGVLRMDVDDLGAIFGRGLGDGATLARVAGLSFRLRLFFEGWLGVLARRHNGQGADGGADHIGVIYSGGDDLFVVGSWDRVVMLAQEIARDFRRFVCENPAVHLSGGMTLAEERFPLYLSADEAGEALERAKGRQEAGVIVKNALNFLAQTVSWEDLEGAAARADELVGLLETRAVSRSLLQTLSTVYRLYEEAAAAPRRRTRPREQQVPYGRWTWMSAYALTRQAEGARGPAKMWIQALRDDLLRPEVVRTLGLTARWAELRARREG